MRGEAGEIVNPWADYSVIKPSKAGPYEWQVPSVSCKGMIVRVLANFRERGAGYTTALSPEFDYWDGYRLHVPEGTMWRAAQPGTTLGRYRQELICVEGLELSPCPFCRSTPRLKGVQKQGRGIISADAHTFNSWWLECCSWAKTPHFDDPRRLEAARRSALAEARDG